MSLTFVESSQHKEAAAEKGKSGNEYYGHVFIHSPLPLKKDPAWQDGSSSALSLLDSRIKRYPLPWLCILDYDREDHIYLEKVTTGW